MIITTLAVALLSLAPQEANSSARTLVIEQSCQPSRLAMDEPITITVTLSNKQRSPLLLFGTLEWGYSAGLVLALRSSAGEEIYESVPPDVLFPPTAVADPSRYLLLQPDHFFGTRRTERAQDLFPNPGTYELKVGYLSPVTRQQNDNPRLWGREKGIIYSTEPCVITVLPHTN